MYPSMRLYQVVVTTKLFFVVLSGFSHKYFFNKKQTGAKSGEQTSKTPTEFHLKKKKKPQPPARNAKTLIWIKCLSAFNFLKDKIFQESDIILRY